VFGQMTILIKEGDMGLLLTWACANMIYDVMHQLSPLNKAVITISFFNVLLTTLFCKTMCKACMEKNKYFI